MDRKVVIITGASSGIGRVTALRLARSGHDVVLASRQGDVLEKMAEECRRHGGRALAVATDVAREEDMKALADVAVERMGHFDVWINNAAVAAYGRFEDIPSNVLRRAVEVNVLGCMYGSQQAIRHFRHRRRGHLINISSVVGVLGQPFSALYAAGKFAVRGLCLSLQAEFSDDRNINISCVMPATIDTPFFRHAANYMGCPVKALPPVFEPGRVAEVILKLLKKPKPEVFVGANPMGMMGVRMMFPHMFEKGWRRYTLKNHFVGQSAWPSEGNLFVPRPAAT